jgi:hypothetical protein
MRTQIGKKSSMTLALKKDTSRQYPDPRHTTNNPKTRLVSFFVVSSIAVVLSGIFFLAYVFLTIKPAKLDLLKTRILEMSLTLITVTFFCTGAITIYDAFASDQLYRESNKASCKNKLYKFYFKRIANLASI